MSTKMTVLDENTSPTNASDVLAPMELQLTYTVLEILVAIVAVVGNGMVILVFWKERRLRRRTNYYIVSLAVADLLVGLLGIPFAIMAAIGLPTNLHACLFTLSLLIVLCTISIFCLVAVSVDRYWAILHPMGYSRNVRTKTAIVIISLCWVAGSVIGFLPLFGWHAATSQHISCFFVRVMDYDFLVFLYFSTIITPSLILAAFYAHIYRVVVKQLQQIVTMNPASGSSFRGNNESTENETNGSGTMLRVLGAAQKREVKATKNLSIIVLFFIICWIPLYTINCVKAFCPDCYIGPTWTDFCIILSHLNSAVNPILYAYHLRDFRAALKSLLYTIFGIKESNPANETYYKPSVISQQRRQSTLERRSNNFHNNQPKIYVDSPIWLRQKAAEISNSTICIASPSGLASSIKADFNNLSNKRSFSPDEQQNRKIWMISEIPSLSDERESDDCIQTISKINKPLIQEDYDEDDDDVFLPSDNQLTTIQYDFKNDNLFDVNMLSDKNSSQDEELQNTKTVQKENGNAPHSQSRKNSIFIVDDETDDNEKLSLKLKEPEKITVCNANCKIKKLSKSESPPSSNLKLSPLKIVNKFIFNQSTTKYYSKSIIDDGRKKNKDLLTKQGSSNILQYLDLQRNGITHERYVSNDDAEDR